MSYINKEQAIDLIESMIADKGVAFNPHKLAMALKDMESVEIPEAKDTDLISRQAAIDAVEKAVFKGVAKSAIESLPPVEPPKKVVAQVKVDTDEIMERIKEECERIKEEYEITDQPVCEDAIRCYEFLKERIGSDITDNAEEFEKWFERMVWHVQKCNEHDTEMRNVSEDAISRADTIKAMCSKCVIKEECIGECSDVVVIKNMPPVEPERPKGEWVEYIDDMNGARYGKGGIENENDIR